MELLEAEVDDLNRSVQALQDENAFLQRLLGDPSTRRPSHGHPPEHRRGPCAPAGASVVAAGILLSRIVGLVRKRVFAHYFGTSDAADAFNAAFRIPNFLQNLFGEGVLSASFIPVYARLRARGRDAGGAPRRPPRWRRCSGSPCRCWCWRASCSRRWLIDLIAPGFEGEKRAATIRLVRILFPGAGLLVLSAWCLGVLNSHRRFFLSYVAPVVWNLAIIAALRRVRRRDRPVRAGRGRRLGLGGRQPAPVRWSSCRRCSGCSAGCGPGRSSAAPVRTVSAISGRCSWAAAWCRSAPTSTRCWRASFRLARWPRVSYAQVLYTLPVSLFGMSVSAAELPEMASATGTEAERAAHLRGRLEAGLRQIAFFVVPSAVGVHRAGRRGDRRAVPDGRVHPRDDAVRLGHSRGGLRRAAPLDLGRLYSSAFYALHDTRTPLRFALLRVASASRWAMASPCTCRPRSESMRRWGAAGITLASGLAAAWSTCCSARALRRGSARARLDWGLLMRLWIAAAGGGRLAWWSAARCPDRPIPAAALVLGVFGATYLARLGAARRAAARRCDRGLLPRHG